MLGNDKDEITEAVKILSVFLDLLDGKEDEAIKRYLEFSKEERISILTFADKFHKIVNMHNAELRAQLALLGG